MEAREDPWVKRCRHWRLEVEPAGTGEAKVQSQGSIGGAEGQKPDCSGWKRDPKVMSRRACADSRFEKAEYADKKISGLLASVRHGGRGSCLFGACFHGDGDEPEGDMDDERGRVETPGDVLQEGRRDRVMCMEALGFIGVACPFPQEHRWSRCGQVNASVWCFHPLEQLRRQCCLGAERVERKDVRGPMT